MPLAPQDIRTFFVTFVAAGRRRLFQTEQNSQLMLNVLSDNRAMGRFSLHAFVLMPDHVHFVITPAPDVSLEKAMQFIKGGFSFRLKSKMDVWERSFKEHRIKDRVDYRNHCEYTEQNPVRKFLVTEPAAYPFSSVAHPELVDPAPAQLG